ncbi:MAG: glutaredoxin family protein [Chloroflexota bacterium]
MHELVLYARPGCHLCDETRVLLDALIAERRAAGLPLPALVERDIDGDPALREAFGATVPVVELGDRRLELVTSAARLRRLLTDVLDAPDADAIPTRS